MTLSPSLSLSLNMFSGVPVGKKGPLIQIGSIIAAVVSQGKNAAFGFDISWTKFLDFRNDRQKVSKCLCLEWWSRLDCREQSCWCWLSLRSTSTFSVWVEMLMPVQYPDLPSAWFGLAWLVCGVYVCVCVSPLPFPCSVLWCSVVLL